MPLNIRTMNDAVLQGFVQCQQWQQEFLEQWLEPEIKLEQAKRRDQALAAFEFMLPEMRAQLQAQFPEAYATAEEGYRKLKGNPPGGFDTAKNTPTQPTGSIERS